MTHHPYSFDRAELHGSLADPAMESMNFLNQIAEQYPTALSLAAGRPTEAVFDLADLPRHLETFCRYLREEKNATESDVRRTVFQYGRTKGIIHELIAANLRVDEGIDVDPEAVVVTVGCQEAMFLALRALRRDERDVLLAVSPSYVGIAGAARLVDMKLLPVREGADGVLLDDLAAQVRAARAAGLRPRALYLIPDFANPSGLTMPLNARHSLLAAARELGLLLLEDNPYGLFRADGGERLPTLKSLDTTSQVVYLGSLAKTAFPGARVGYAVADQTVRSPGTDRSLLADEMAKIKSMLTVNTSPMAQALVGGKLLESDCSLVKANADTIAGYSRNLERLLTGLQDRFGHQPGISWSRPIGGFFVVVTVPFQADNATLEYSAGKHRLLWTPMSHFYQGEGGERQLRLSVSSVVPEQIDLGLDRLRSLVDDLTANHRL
ncbi:GntR family transcriptional regulator [Streptomyces yokosukanensis]|uniref:GntR family transcriptional regulator n=2 Tax=Streptomyces yokosukanensis TaxID=67386 RepID=A0A101NRJ0_9ACTN|nr:GntR family transcriptional regulator [Streptomyces yokosukanensis]